MCNYSQTSIRRLCGRWWDQIPPQVASTGHVHKGPEPWFHGRANLQAQKCYKPKRERWNFLKWKRNGYLGKSIRGVSGVVVGLIVGGVQLGRLGFEVSKDEEAGESGWKEDENESQRTHFFSQSLRQRQRESERETIEKCRGSDNRGRSRKGAVEEWSILVRESGHWLTWIQVGLICNFGCMR